MKLNATIYNEHARATLLGFCMARVGNSSSNLLYASFVAPTQVTQAVTAELTTNSRGKNSVTLSSYGDYGTTMIGYAYAGGYHIHRQRLPGTNAMHVVLVAKLPTLLYYTDPNGILYPHMSYQYKEEREKLKAQARSAMPLLFHHYITEHTKLVSRPEWAKALWEEAQHSWWDATNATETWGDCILAWRITDKQEDLLAIYNHCVGAQTISMQ